METRCQNKRLNRVTLRASKTLARLLGSSLHDPVISSCDTRKHCTGLPHEYTWSYVVPKKSLNFTIITHTCDNTPRQPKYAPDNPLPYQAKSCYGIQDIWDQGRHLIPSLLWFGDEPSKRNHWSSRWHAFRFPLHGHSSTPYPSFSDPDCIEIASKLSEEVIPISLGYRHDLAHHCILQAACQHTGPPCRPSRPAKAASCTWIFEFIFTSFLNRA